LTRTVLDVSLQPGLRRILRQVGDAVTIGSAPETVDRYEAATTLAAVFRIDLWAVYDELARLYPDAEGIPSADLDVLAGQIAEQTRKYEEREERVERSLALVKQEGFARLRDVSGAEVYATEITYPKDREHLLLPGGRSLRENPAGFGFHYDPYNFDSTPELEFFHQLLRELNVRPAEVEDVYFTGGLTDPAKTDFFVQYRGEDGRWHRYTPDFLIRKRPRPGSAPGTGRVLVVEIKDARFRTAIAEDERRAGRGEEAQTPEGRKAMALRRLEGLNPDQLRYEILFADGVLGYEQLGGLRHFVREPERAYVPDLATAMQLKDRILRVDGGRARKVILFGSRARGDARPDSDFDLLVLVRGMSTEETRAYRLELWRALRGAGVSAEPWVMDEAEFEETKAVIGGLAHPAWREGVLIHENS